MRSPKETTGRGDDGMYAGERSLKTWKRRRLGGELPPGYEQLFHSLSSQTQDTLSLQLCFRCSHTPDSVCAQEKKPLTSLKDYNQETISWSYRFYKLDYDIWNPRDVWVGSGPDGMIKESSSSDRSTAEDSHEASGWTLTRCRCELHLLVRPWRIGTKPDDTALRFHSNLCSTCSSLKLLSILQVYKFKGQSSICIQNTLGKACNYALALIISVSSAARLRG